MEKKVHWRPLAIVENNEVKKNKEVNKKNKKNEKKVHWRRLPIID